MTVRTREAIDRDEGRAGIAQHPLVLHRRSLRAVLSISIGLLITLASQAMADSTLEVTSPSGAVNRIVSPSGGIDQEFPTGSERSPDLAVANVAAVEDPSIEHVHYRDPATGRHVDPEGAIEESAGEAGVRSATASIQAEASLQAERVTIDQMTFGSTYLDNYSPIDGFVIFGPAKRYYLSNGNDWRSGAGSHYRARAKFDRSEIDGSTIRYYFDPPDEGFLYKQTDYNSGDHSSNGSLGAAGPLVIEAEIGSSTGMMSGDVSILSNIPANYSEPRFNYFSAPMGAIVPFNVTFTLGRGSIFSETTFDSAFSYSNDGVVDFTDPSSIPPLTSVEVFGSAQIGAGSQTQYHAVATYQSGALENVTDTADWTVTPAGVAAVEAGLLTTASEGCDGVALELSATFTSNDSTETGTRTLKCRDFSADEWTDYWETYQGDERHSGYIPISLEPEVFTLRWRREVAPGARLNPVTAADGKVFVSIVTYFTGGDSLFALDARDGEPLWSREFGSPFSINPPAYGYGNVYIQTGNHGSDTYLWAFDAATGDQVFQSPHAAQWERYYAPTIYEGSVYVNGGYYGGMYGFDAFSGANLWFADLPQYDEFTPAVDDEHVYAYVGSYSPGLYVVDRESGQLDYQIRDPNFDWNGWSMDLAPVLGSMENVITIHDGRLISFDLTEREIGFEISAGFTGQPSVAKSVIYAINNGSVEARNESDGALLWKWIPATRDATEHVIVTDTHLLARTASATHAIELLSGESVWSYAAAGHMALGEETLYIASQDGFVTAISIPEYTTAAIIKVEIDGPTEVQEYTTTPYTAWAYYDDGRVRRRTNLANWSVTPSEYASINEYGELAVGELLTPSQDVVVHANYLEGDTAVEDELAVTLEISVSLDAFVERNVAAALAAKRAALEALKESVTRELAAIRVIEGKIAEWYGSQSTLRHQLDRLRRAEFWGVFGQRGVENGVDALEEELAEERIGD